MLGVDKLDQLISYYSFLHKSIKWWRKIFFWILEVAVINSYIIYKTLAKERGEKPISHLAYRRQLVHSLSEPIRSTAQPKRRSGPRASVHVERLRPIQHYLHKRNKRRDCMVCSSREEGGTRHLTLYVCGTCPEQPALCPSNCFEEYHTCKNYRQ